MYLYVYVCGQTDSVLSAWTLPISCTRILLTNKRSCDVVITLTCHHQQHFVAHFEQKALTSYWLKPICWYQYIDGYLHSMATWEKQSSRFPWTNQQPSLYYRTGTKQCLAICGCTHNKRQYWQISPHHIQETHPHIQKSELLPPHIFTPPPSTINLHP